MSRDESRSAIRTTAAVVAIASAVLGLLGGAVTGSWRARAEVRSVAADVVNEAWIAKFQAATTQIAKEAATAAAREAADKAIRESVTPLAIDLASHMGQDQGRREGWRDNRGGR